MRRRSVRADFTERTPPNSVVRQIVQAGLAAPSAKNAQPWRLHVVRDPGLIAWISEQMMAAPGREEFVPVDPLSGQPHPGHVSTVAASAAVIAAVPLVIVVESLEPFSSAASGARAPGADQFAIRLDAFAVGAAVQNMWLAATSFGLAGVFLADAAVASDAIVPRLGLKGALFGALALGYSRVDATPPMNAALLPEIERAVWHGDSDVDRV
jgi:nitroreductase